jgi:hypothetical protein
VQFFFQLEYINYVDELLNALFVDMLKVAASAMRAHLGINFPASCWLDQFLGNAWMMGFSWLFFL